MGIVLKVFAPHRGRKVAAFHLLDQRWQPVLLDGEAIAIQYEVKGIILMFYKIIKDCCESNGMVSTMLPATRSDFF